MLSASALLIFFGVVLGGNLALALAGVAVHHGATGLLAVWALGLLGKWTRRAVFWRLRQRGKSPRPSWFVTIKHGVRSGVRSTALVFVLPSAGYAWAALTAPLPLVLRLLLSASLVGGLAFLLWRRERRLPETREQWQELYTRARRFQLEHVGWLVLGAVWPMPTTSAQQLLTASAEQQGLHPQLDSFAWIGTPARGLPTAFTSARALVLVAQPDSPNDVFLIRFGLAFDGTPARLLESYNLTNTAMANESQLRVWERWAAWTLSNDQGVRSVEIADLRHEPTGSGPEWTQLKGLQRAITNRQQTGQWRGIGRSRVDFQSPAAAAELAIAEGVVALNLPDRKLRLDLGRTPDPETLGKDTVYVTTPTTLPGSLVPWAVDRMRAVPWVGSSRMQWVKGWVFRAGEQLEELENQVIGIDPHETISEELGELLETLPLAESGQVPGWPPKPLEPPMNPTLTGEGRWVNLGSDVVVPSSPGLPTPFVFTFIRTDPSKAYIQTSITMWDPRQVQLHIVAGTEEPKSMTGELGSGTIPREALGRLVAAFNGAFQAVHGEFGMMERRAVQLPPKPYAATVATFPDGTAGFGTWPEERSVPPNMLSFRQNLVPLVVDGKRNPYRNNWWGGAPVGWTEETRTVRSGLCLTEEGFMAYFYSPGITPDALADAMLVARCSYGMHLDMNAGHTGFEFYRVAPEALLPQLGRSLDPLWEARGQIADRPDLAFFSRLMVRKMPLMNFPRYIHTTARDFFYLTRRPLLPGPPLSTDPPSTATENAAENAPENAAENAESAAAAQTSPDPGTTKDGQWRLADLDGSGFPHAVAFTTVTPTAGDRVIISRLDPQQLTTAQADAAQLAVLSETDEEASAKVWFVEQRFSVAATAPAGAQLVLPGHPEPTEVTRALACVDGDGMLSVAQAEARSVLTRETLESLRIVLRCEQAAYLTQAPTLRLEVGEVQPEHQGQRASFKKRGAPSAKRIFTDTPILPPEKWAIPQRQRGALTDPTR